MGKPLRRLERQGTVATARLLGRAVRPSDHPTAALEAWASTYALRSRRAGTLLTAAKYQRVGVREDALGPASLVTQGQAVLVDSGAKASARAISATEHRSPAAAVSESQWDTIPAILACGSPSGATRLEHPARAVGPIDNTCP